VAANPELATVDVYRSGPLGDVIDDITSYVDVYGRGMRELHSLLEHVQTASN
jgi:TatD DNase family protein